MGENALFWFLLNFSSIIILAFYSMMEMACVSFNRVRLHYYVSKGEKRALLLNELLHQPSKLFGTTLIMVNVATVFGSEFSREFYEAIGLSPDLAPLTQVLLVLIFGELSPMFAARAHSEHMALLGVRLLYASAQILAPFLWLLNLVTSLSNAIFNRNKVQTDIYLTQEELQKILEEHEEDQPYASDREQFNAITSNIFSLRHKAVSQIMTPLNHVPIIPSNATIEQTRKFFRDKKVNYAPIYHNDRSNIIGIVLPRDLIRASDSKKVREFGRTPWFVSENTTLTHILHQFRHNNQEVALILDLQGNAVGLTTLDDLLEEVFGKAVSSEATVKRYKSAKKFVIDRTFPGTFTIEDFYNQYSVLLDDERKLTLAEFIEKELGYHPETGESIYIDPFELTVKETSLHSIKTINIKTKIK